MKAPMREEMARRKAETIDPDLNDQYRFLGDSAEQSRRTPQQATRPSVPQAPVAQAAEEARTAPRSAAEAARGMRPESTQGARSGPVRGGGSGGGAGFKTNTGHKGATPMPSDFTLNVYAKGGPVGRVGSFGLHRSKPDFAGGGSKTNFKSWTKKGDKPW